MIINAVTSEVLSSILDYIYPHQEVNQIVNVSLDGTTNIQIIGEPAVTYDLRFCVYSTQKQLFEAAHASGALLKVTDEYGADYYGRITKLVIDNEDVNLYRMGTATLVKEVVVA